MPHDDCKTAENLCNYSFTVDKLNRYTYLIIYLLGRYSWIISEFGILIVEPMTKIFSSVFSGQHADQQNSSNENSYIYTNI